jgi:DNA invertase Pin-like site-specific DNA recombinase
LGTASGRFQLQVFAAFAELERSLIAERCTAGRIEAKRRGVKFGPKNQSAILAKAKEVERLYKLGLKVKEIQKIMGIRSNKTVYNYLNLVSKKL